MKKGRYLKDTPKKFPIVVVTILFVIGAVVLVLCLRGCDNTLPSNVGINNEPETTVEKNPDSIAIPGYEMLQLTADTKKQTLSFPNPPQNMCYFQLSLYLEDGTLLWESELIKPGKTSKPIVLEKPLEEGTYPNAVLRYSCFRMDEARSPLNGAEMKLTLWVS